MSKVAELAYDIEQLYIEGFSPRSISAQLGCPLAIVYDWLESCNVSSDEDVVEKQQDEPYSPYYGA
jgi:hypothetical protein